jgi:hypothetical protein
MSLITPFISSCPSSNPPLDTFPTFNITDQFPGTATPGATAKVQLPPSPGGEATFIVLLFNDTTIPIPIDNGTIVYPEFMSGQAYAIATKSPTDISDNSTLFGPVILDFTFFSNGTLTS